VSSSLFFFLPVWPASILYFLCAVAKTLLLLNLSPNAYRGGDNQHNKGAWLGSTKAFALFRINCPKIIPTINKMHTNTNTNIRTRGQKHTHKHSHTIGVWIEDQATESANILLLAKTPKGPRFFLPIHPQTHRHVCICTFVSCWQQNAYR